MSGLATKYILAGTVVHGDEYGRKIGFPTANIDRRQWVRSKLDIPLGIYAGIVELANGKQYKAGIVIGPIDRRGLPKLEAHLIGYRGNLYGQRITFHVKKFLRKFKPYKTEALLKQQIAADIAAVNKLAI